jgi:hypothetical protein
MESKFSRCDLPGALSDIDNLLEQQNEDPDRAFVVLISDFANDALAVDRPAPRVLAQLAKRAKLVVARPTPSVANTQIARLVPRRTLILPGSDDANPTVAVEIQLRRFLDTSSPGRTSVELAVLDRDSLSPVSVVQQDHTWAVGQSQAVIHATAILDSIKPHPPGAPDDERVLLIRTRIAPVHLSGSPDALTADDERWATVSVRDQLRIGLVSTPRTSPVDSLEQGLTSAQWLHLALTPHTFSNISSLGQTHGTLGWGAVMVTPFLPKGLDADTPQAFDAIFVPRPDLLSNPQWEHVRNFVQRGGLLWVSAPSASQRDTWGETMADLLGLEWQLRIEANQNDSTQPQPNSDESLATDTPVPEPLSLLAADWQALLAPVRVKKAIRLNPRVTALTSGEVWLATAKGDPLLVSQRIGDGTVVLLATAIDPAWTNLPTKPLFVPLLHETLRGVLGSPRSTSQLQKLLSGDVPVLDKKWAGAKRLIRTDATTDAADTTVNLLATDRGFESEAPLDKPGIYTPGVIDIAGTLAVNPDPLGGDTRAIDPERLGQWLSSVSTWQWLDDSDPRQSLAVQSTSTSFGWPLLCILMGLVVIEMALARWFSHVFVPGRGIIAQAIAALRGGSGGRNALRT